MIVGTAGHVDHGKSTIVRLLTGTDPDRWEEERRRGLTIDLGFASLTLPSGRRVSFVDVPGHARFVKNMLAGTGGFDLVVLCVAADEGWMPQTEEHTQILDVLGVRHGVVALTKCDTVDAATVEERELEVEIALEGTSLEGAPVVRTAATDAATHGRLRDALDAAAGRAAAGAAPSPTPRPRLWIDRVFTVKGAGTVVTGTLTGGPLAAGDEVDAGGVPARIRGVHVHDEAVAVAEPGTRTALNLVLGRAVSLRRGDAVTAATPQWESGRRLQVWLRPVRGRRRRTASRGAFHLHVGTAAMPARLSVLGPAAGGGHFGRLHLPRPAAPVAIGDRFVLRDESDTSTMGGGVILAVTGRDLGPPGRERRLAAALADPHERAAAIAADLLGEAGGVLAAAEMVRAVGAPSPAATVRLGEFVFGPEHLAAERARLAGAPGPVPLPGDGASLAVVAALERDGVVEVADGLVWPPGAGATRASESAVAAAAVTTACELAGVRLLTAREAASASGTSARLVDRMLADGRLQRVGEFVTTPAVRGAVERTVREVLGAGPATASALREALGTTRKWALPILEALDRAGITRREGELRVLVEVRESPPGSSQPDAGRAGAPLHQPTAGPGSGGP